MAKYLFEGNIMYDDIGTFNKNGGLKRALKGLVAWLDSVGGDESVVRLKGLG